MKIESDLIAGGYSLTRPIPTPEFLEGELLPETIFSAGQCTAGLPGIVHWAGGEPEKLGVPIEKIEALNEWAKTSFEVKFGYPDTFYTLESIREFIQMFIPNPPSDLMIVCAALSRSIAEDFIRTEKKDAAVGERGIYHKLTRLEVPAPNGDHLGYEPLCYDLDLDHTWLCYELHREAYERWGIKPNQLGFVADLEDANKVVSLAEELNAGNGLWLPWTILRYSVLE